MPVKDKFRYIIVEGCPGVGKTALAKRLADTLDDGLLMERNAANPFLSDLYRGPGNAALPVQLYFLFEHVQQLRGLQQADLFVASRVADFLIQAHRLFAEATLGQDELELYYQVYKLLVKDIPAPDLVIYLQSSLDVLVKRIRASAPESKIDREYLRKISAGYTDFFYHYDASSLLIVNTTDLDLSGESGDYDVLLHYLDQLGPGRHYFNPLGL